MVFVQPWCLLLLHDHDPLQTKGSIHQTHLAVFNSLVPI